MERGIDLVQCRRPIELGKDHGRRIYELEREWDNEFGYLISRVYGVYVRQYIYFVRLTSIIMDQIFP
jgi:hypothetical protein